MQESLHCQHREEEGLQRPATAHVACEYCNKIDLKKLDFGKQRQCLQGEFYSEREKWSHPSLRVSVSDSCSLGKSVKREREINKINVFNNKLLPNLSTASSPTPFLPAPREAPLSHRQHSF